MENKTGFLKKEIALVLMIAFVLSAGTWIYVKQVKIGRASCRERVWLKV